MKPLCKVHFATLLPWFLVATIGTGLLFLGACTPARAAQGIVDARLTGASNTLQSGATFTANSGSTFNFNGTVNFSTPLSPTNGGLGVSLTDPGADRILFWDESAGNIAYLTNGSGLIISGTTISFDTSVAAPVGASYITKVAESGLSGEFALGSLATGLLGVTTTTGNLSSITTSAGVLALITDANGTGSMVFDTSPDLTTPTITGVISFENDQRQTFSPGSTNAGFNVGSVSTDPSSRTNGDIWYNSTSNNLKAQVNGSAVALGSGGGSGDVVGPSSATNARLAIFDTTTGKLLKDSSNIAANSGTMTSSAAMTLSTSSSNNINLYPDTAGRVEILNNTAPQLIIRGSSNANYASFRLYNDQNSGVRALQCDYMGSSYSGADLTGGPTGESGNIATTGAYPLSFGTDNNFVAMFTADGNFLVGTTSTSGLTGAGGVKIASTTASSSSSTGALIVAGGVGIAGSAVVGGSLIVPTHTPSSSSDTGTAGTITWDTSFIYICTATNTWKRVAIATW